LFRPERLGAKASKEHERGGAPQIKICLMKGTSSNLNYAQISHQPRPADIISSTAATISFQVED
jgi:hypothetical protein